MVNYYFKFADRLWNFRFFIQSNADRKIHGKILYLKNVRKIHKKAKRKKCKKKIHEKNGVYFIERNKLGHHVFNSNFPDLHKKNRPREMNKVEKKVSNTKSSMDCKPRNPLNI